MTCAVFVLLPAVTTSSSSPASHRPPLPRQRHPSRRTDLQLLSPLSPPFGDEDAACGGDASGGHRIVLRHFSSLSHRREGEPYCAWRRRRQASALARDKSDESAVFMDGALSVFRCSPTKRTKYKYKISKIPENLVSNTSYTSITVGRIFILVPPAMRCVFFIFLFS